MVVLLYAFTFIDITASAARLIILGLDLPVAVSMRLLHILLEKAVMLRQNGAEWMVYLPGILCRKQTLINVAFSSKTALREFYIRCPASHSSSSLLYSVV